MKSLGDRSIVADIDDLEDCILLNSTGEKVKIHKLWESKPAILVFLRHFACDACRKHAVEVWAKKDLFQANGSQIHFIGNGTVHFMNEFRKQHKLEDANFYTDPTLRSFKAAGFKKGFWISPGEMHTRSEFLWLAVRYQMRTKGEGNVWQLGGVLVVKPGGKISYQFTSLAMGHFPPSDDVINYS